MTLQIRVIGILKSQPYHYLMYDTVIQLKLMQLKKNYYKANLSNCVQSDLATKPFFPPLRIIGKLSTDACQRLR